MAAERDDAASHPGRSGSEADGATVIQLPLTIDLEDPQRGSSAPRLLIVGTENRPLLAALGRLLPADKLQRATSAPLEPLPGSLAMGLHPLVLFGPSSTGKTLLVESASLCRDRCVILDAHEMARGVQQAREEHRLEALRREWSDLELLAIENFDRCPLSEGVQRELCVVLDRLADQGGLAVITAAREPGCWQRVTLALRDRLCQGLTVPLRRPALATREALIAWVAARRGIALTPEQMSRLVESKDDDPRRLWGQLAELELGLPGAASEAPACRTTSAGEHHGTLKRVVATTARYFGVSQAALTGPSRRQSLVHARGVSIRVARLVSSASYAQIGRVLGNRDHTTILHAERKIQAEAAGDASLQFAIDELTRIVGN